MDNKVIRGVPWTLLSYGGGRAISVITTVVLARLVAPADFGLLALATLATSFLSWIADMGFSGTLILRHDLDGRDQGTILSLMAVSGLLAGGIAVALSPLAAAVFHAPRLVGVLAATALLLPLGSIAGFWQAILQREFKFRRRFAGMMTQSIVAAVVSITLAALGAGVWALVIGQVSATAMQCVVLVALSPYRPRPAFDRAMAASAFRTSRGFVGQGLAGYIRQQVDTITVGIAFSPRRVGFYSMANRFGDLMYWVIAHPVAIVTFPSFAQRNSEGEDIRPPFLRVLGMIALVSCPIGVILSGAAEPFTRALFGTRWLPMVGPLTVMGLWGALRQIDTTIGWLLNSLGRAGAVGWLSVIVLPPLIVGCVIASQIGGLTAVALVPLVDTLLSAAIGSVLSKRFLSLGYRAQWHAIRPAVLASVPTWLVVRVISELLDPGHPVLALPLAVIAGLLAYSGTVSLVEPGSLKEAMAQVVRMVGRPSRTAAAPE